MHLVDVTMFYGGAGGGVSTYLDAKARWLAAHSGLRHTIASPNLPPYVDRVVRDRVVRAGLPHLASIPGVPLPGMDGYRLPRSTEAAMRVLETLRPDMIEVGDAGPCAWAALRVRERSQAPVVGFYHSDLPLIMRRKLGAAAGRLARHYVKRLYSQFDLVLAPSAAMVRRLAGMGLRAMQQPLGIDTAVFQPQRRDAGLREQLNLPASTRLLVYAGRGGAAKRLEVLEAAVRRLGAPYHLLLIGGRSRGRRGPVTWLPFQANPRELARLLASGDMLVQPSDSETFGLVVLEAMACGRPVVVTSGALAELVDDRSGVVVPPGSVGSLCDGIAHLYGQDLAALGRHAWRAASLHYDWNRVLPQLMARYDALLATGSAYVQQ